MRRNHPRVCVVSECFHMLVYQKPLATKLYLPETPADYVERPELYAQLDEGQGRSLTSVCAPAGYGKTSLIAGWLRSKHHPGRDCAWYTIDETDDIGRFVTYLVSAIRTIQPDFYPDWVEPEQRAAAVTIEDEAWGLVNACQELRPGLLLVLDDYHLVEDSRVHRLMSLYIRHLPGTPHLVILSRSELPRELDLVRLRGRDRLNELVTADLAFSREDAMAFMARNVPAGVNDSLIDTIWRRTEGWCVGLRLAGMSLRASHDHAEYEQLFNQYVDRNVSSFLFEQALIGQTPELVQFLLQSSVLERFNVDSMAALTGQSRSAVYEMLNQIIKQNLFVVPLDDFREWYRFHSQFRSMLLKQLELKSSADEMRDLHMRAAAWLQTHDLVDDALLHYLAIGDVENAADLVEREIPRIMNQERFETLRRWLDQLPESVVSRRPRLLLGKAWHHIFHLRYQRVPPLLDQAEAALEAGKLDEADKQAMRGQILAIRSAPALGLPVDVALANIPAGLAAMPREYGYLRAMLVNFHAQRLDMAGKFDEAMALLTAELERAPSRYSTFAARLIYSMGAVTFNHGDIRGFRQLGMQLMDVGRALNLPALIAWAEYGIALYEWEQEGPEAAKLMDNIIHRRQAIQFHVLLFTANFLLPDYARQGRYQDGMEMLSLLRRQIAQWYDARIFNEFEALQATWDVEVGNTAAAEKWAANAGDEHPTTLMSFRGWRLGYVLIRLGRPDTLRRAKTLLTELAERYRAQGDRRGLVQSLTLAAQAHWLLNEREVALGYYAEAVEIGYPLGIRRTLIDAAISAQAMLCELMNQKNVSRTVLELLSTLTTNAAADRRMPELRDVHQDAPEDESEVLSYRELEILRLMGRGLSNRDIGSILFISENTVRSHARRIFEKVGARSRGEAVFRAQQLGLLATDSPPV